MSRATAGLLATANAMESRRDAPEEEVWDETDRQGEPAAVELVGWIDALALTLAAGMRVGARGLDHDADAVVANDQASPAPPDRGAATVIGGEGDDVLTVEDAAELLKLGRNQLYEAIGRGDVPHRRIGRIIRLSRAALMRWLAGSCEAAAAKGHR